MEVRREKAQWLLDSSLLQTTQKQSQENRPESFASEKSQPLIRDIGERVRERRIQSLARTRGERSAFQSPAVYFAGRITSYIRYASPHFASLYCSERCSADIKLSRSGNIEREIASGRMNDTSRSLAQQAPLFFCKPELPTRWIFHVGSNTLEPNRDLYHLFLSALR